MSTCDGAAFHAQEDHPLGPGREVRRLAGPADCGLLGGPGREAGEGQVAETRGGWSCSSVRAGKHGFDDAYRIHRRMRSSMERHRAARKPMQPRLELIDDWNSALANSAWQSAVQAAAAAGAPFVGCDVCVAQELLGASRVPSPSAAASSTAGRPASAALASSSSFGEQPVGHGLGLADDERVVHQVQRLGRDGRRRPLADDQARVGEIEQRQRSPARCRGRSAGRRCDAVSVACRRRPPRKRKLDVAFAVAARPDCPWAASGRAGR